MDCALQARDVGTDLDFAHEAIWTEALEMAEDTRVSTFVSPSDACNLIILCRFVFVCSVPVSICYTTASQWAHVNPSVNRCDRSESNHILVCTAAMPRNTTILHLTACSTCWWSEPLPPAPTCSFVTVCPVQVPTAHRGFLARSKAIDVLQLYRAASESGRHLVLCGHSLGEHLCLCKCVCN